MYNKKNQYGLTVPTINTLLQSCSSFSKKSTLEPGTQPTTGQPPKDRPDGCISWPLLKKSCCTSTWTRFSPHWIATLLGVTGCLNWKSTDTSRCTSGTMGNLQSKGLTGPCNTCFSWRPRGSCANLLESWLWNREAFCKGFQNPWEERTGPLETGSDCGFMLLGLWLYLKLPHAFFRSKTTITTSTNTPWKDPSWPVLTQHHNTHQYFSLPLSAALNLGGSSPFSLIDCLWFSSGPVEFMH